MKLTLGEKIRMLRENKDISQSQLGQAVGMTQRKVSYIECDKYEPSIQDIYELCKFFGISADYLLGLPQGLNYLQK